MAGQGAVMVLLSIQHAQRSLNPKPSPLPPTRCGHLRRRSPTHNLPRRVNALLPETALPAVLVKSCSCKSCSNLVIDLRKKGGIMAQHAGPGILMALESASRVFHLGLLVAEFISPQKCTLSVL